MLGKNISPIVIEFSWFSSLTPGKSGAMMVLFYMFKHLSSIVFNNRKALGFIMDFFRSYILQISCQAL